MMLEAVRAEVVVPCEGGRLGGHLQGKLLTQVICVQRTAAAWKGDGEAGRVGEK